MSTINKLRTVIAITVAASLTFTLAACSFSNYGKDAEPQTSNYLYSQFVDGKYLDPYETEGDIGITMESMVQLSAVGYDKSKFTKAIDWLTSNTQLLKSPGLKAEYVFTAHALGFADHPTVAQKLKELKDAIGPDYVIADTNTFSYCWVILGLAAAGEKTLANNIALEITNYNEASGGYKYIYGDKKSPEAADVTGFVILAVLATKGFGNSDEESIKNFITGRAKIWLTKNVQSDGHWNGYGGIDISGTAYASMALHALEKNTDEYITWLKQQINAKDGGIVAPWTEPASDIFSTSQSILALNNLSFIDVLEHASK
jgi:hypothetical protein